MKIQIDTEKKTIKIESSILAKELFKGLDKLFPNKEWKEYTLETNTTIVGWTNPFYVNYPFHYPSYPWYQVATAGTSTTSNLCGTTTTTTNHNGESTCVSINTAYNDPNHVFNVDLSA